MAITTIPPVFYEFAFNASPNQSAIPPYWQDLSARVQFPWTVSRGRQYELDTNETGTWSPVLANPDGALDPGNSGSPFAPGLMLYRGCRIRVQPGANILTPDQATAGQATPYPATASGISAPGQMGVTNDFGYTFQLVSSGSAYSGSQVYQTLVPSGATQYSTILIIPVISVVPGVTYTASAQVRIPSGSTVACVAGLTYFSANGTQLVNGGGTPVTVTSGSSSWTTLTCTTQAPGTSTPAAYAYLKVYINATVGSTTTVQVGALQLEASVTATPWQQPYTVQRNLFPQVIATGSQAMNPISDRVYNWWFVAAPNPSNTLAQSNFITPPASGQTSALAWTSPVGTTSTTVLYCGNWLGLGTMTAQPDCVQVVAGSAYSTSAYVSRVSSADATVQLTASITWFTSANVQIGSPTTGTAVTVPVAPSWAQVTVTGTAPAGAVWGRVGFSITTPASTTAVNTLYLTGLQMEQNSAPTSWIDPGPTYFIFTGSYERLPQTWTEQQGTYGTSQPIGVDAFAGLAQPILLEPFVNQVLALGPNFYYQLNDAASSAQVVDSAGKRPPAPIEDSPYGPGSLTLGSSVSSTSASGGMQGSSGTVAAFANAPSAPGVQNPETFVSLHKTTVTPGPPTSGSYTRIIAFNTSTNPGSGKESNIWTAYPAVYNGDPSSFWIQVDGNGFLEINVANRSNLGMNWTSSSTAYIDGNWHQVAVVQSASALTFYVDGSQVATIGGTYYPTNITTDVLGCSASAGSNAYSQGFTGSVGHVIELPVALSASQVTNLYNSLRSASSGESSGARYKRILSWIGYTGATAIDTGSTAGMGPATDNNGAAALDALNNVALTENGDQYASSSGVLTFKARSARYNQRNPLFVFGEGSPVGNPGEWPCEISQIEYDPSLLANKMQVTQYSTNTIFYANDTASQLNYYPRTYQRTINTTSSLEPQDAANYLLSQYKDPHQRVDVIHLHPSAVPGLMNVCLQLEKGTRIRAIRRPDGAPAITVDCFVEKIDWNWDPDQGDVTVEIQASPANLVNYWQMAALHTTLNAQATSGTNSCVISALPDAATNTLAASLPSGYQLTFEPGTPRQETLTIQPPLPATNPGYSTATLTFTSNFQSTHAAGTVVCEPLPTGYTDPTTWDNSSVLGAAYATITASTSTTVTVSPLPDAKTNPINADWNIGDLVWISPGTPQFQGYNLLIPNVSTAGEGVLPLAAGTSGTVVGLAGAAGTPTVTASASAFQGSQVWQTNVAANQATPSGVLFVNKVVAASLTYTASAYVRSVTTGANPTLYIYVKYLSATGAQLGFTQSGNVALTGSPTAAWTRMSVTGSAPAGTVWAQLGIVLTGTAPSSAWAWQGDGLQLEQNSSASTYQTCPQVSATPTSVPGYGSATLTIATSSAIAAVAGDYLCDPLPPGITNPTTLTPTTRIAY